MHTGLIRPCISPVSTRASGSRKRSACLVGVSLLCLLYGITGKVRATPEPPGPQPHAAVHVGLLPHLSSSLLLKKYQKLVVYLEARLKRRIVVHTAPDFKTYIVRVMEGRYDLYLTAPHLAAYHEAENGHRRVARFSKSLHGVIVVARDSPYQRLQDLQGKRIIAPDPLAVISLLGEVTLMKNNIVATLKYTTSHNNALHSVAQGKAEAAIAGVHAFGITARSMTLKRPLRVLVDTPDIPHMMLMSPGRISTVQRREFESALLNIEQDATGREFVRSVPFGGFCRITDRDMQSLSDMVKILKQRLRK